MLAAQLLQVLSSSVARQATDPQVPRPTLFGFILFLLLFTITFLLFFIFCILVMLFILIAEKY